VLTEPIRAFLQKPLVARMTTIGADGYPHTVPVWFVLDGDDIVVSSVRQTRKVRHIAANPKGAVQVGGGPGDGAGYLLKGDFSIEEDPDDFWMKKLIYQYEEGAQAEKDARDWADLDMIVIRLRPKVVLKV
jgi:PPOX class probable F420-dependent enzyme